MPAADEQLSGPAHQGGGRGAPGADEEATREREVSDDVPIVNGRSDPEWSRWLQGRADTEWSGGNPPGRRVI